MKTLASAVALACLLLSPALAAQNAPSSKEAKCRELLVLMRAPDMAVQMMDGMMGAMKDTMPGIGDDFWTAFRSQVKPDEFVDLLVPIYAETFEESDIDGLIQFYRSPIGKRLVEKQPLILQRSMAAGQKWGEQLAVKALAQMKEKKDG